MYPILTLENVFFSYNSTPILRDVSFQIQLGEFVGIIGPNGGGKTTLLRLIIGFLKPSSGTIRLCDCSPKSSLKHLAYVPQTARFDAQFPISVFELVLLGRLSHLSWYGSFSKQDKLLASEALERVGLLDFKNEPFGNLSGGQAQRALIARALVSNPQILLLDEPTASIDAQAQMDIYSILRNLKGKMAILMVTHDLRAVINEVQKVLCVQGNVSLLNPQEVCEHFAFGLYHPPLMPLGDSRA